jgi:lysophospholipase L1-like esterase
VPHTDDGWEERPVLNRELLQLRANAQRKVLGDNKIIEDENGECVELSPIPRDESGHPAWKNGNSLGTFVSVENEAALGHFHEAIERLATGRETKVRIAAYGASHTQGDLYTGYLRYYLQSRFGNGGPGFMQMARINKYYRKLDFKVESEGFRIEWAQKREPPDHGRFGLLGASALGRFRYAYARVFPKNDTDIDLTADRYELYYSAEPRGGDIKLSISKDKPIIIKTRGEEPEPRYHAFQTGMGWHEIQVRPAGNGPIRIFGLSIERTQPGLVIDTLGISGTRAANMLTWDKKFFHEHLQRRDPDLIMLAYGTNETVDRNQPIEDYERDLRAVLGDLRSVLPDASCLLVGPGDFPKGGGDQWATRPRLLSIIDVQRKVAPDFGCGFWDAFAFMGGEGSMHEWTEAKPALGSPDHIHLTARGYVKMGMALGDALMRAYDAFHLPKDASVASDAN